jgi:ribonuclease HI
VLEVWTDGACSKGVGGWAWATEAGRQGVGTELESTNQRMELRAALEAVRSCGPWLTVVSDSSYVVNCFRQGWWVKWRANGWINSSRKPVKNLDLWVPLVDVVEAYEDVEFRWVKGHSGDRMNELVDRLAVEAREGAAQ